ncbi:Transmembrane domain-containing protein [Cedratvirus Zaza IHUMI]|uniref:Transmembrane domain-containing protein n=1 Tax=Cedratvirus Zaza IHUMI TaxID=2126979 RepID=A0A2R8FFU5_9VIRU|nr:Transmembrane domain-containing protein [Cedratvirus Zaza IHUMI]
MNSLAAENVAHILSFLSPLDVVRFSLCSFHIYEENRLLIESYRALQHKRPPYLDCIKSIVIKEYHKNGIRFTERPGGLLTIYNAELRQTIFMSENLKVTGLGGTDSDECMQRKTCTLRKGQVAMVYLDADCLTKNSPTGERCDYGSLYITEKSPKETYIEERGRKFTRISIAVNFIMACIFCLLLMWQSFHLV